MSPFEKGGCPVGTGGFNPQNGSKYISVKASDVRPTTLVHSSHTGLTNTSTGSPFATETSRSRR